MKNRIDDQKGGREDGAADSPVPTRLLHLIRSGAWRAAAKHYGLSAAKVTSTLAFAFSIGIGLGVVLASGLDDSAGYDQVRGYASEPSEPAHTITRKSPFEPPYSIEVSVRENSKPAASPLGDIFADVPTEPGRIETPKSTVDEPAALPERSESDAPKQSVAPRYVESDTSATPGDREPNLPPIATESAIDDRQAGELPGDKSDSTKVPSLEATSSPVSVPKVSEKPVDVPVAAALPGETTEEKITTPALPVVEDGDAVRDADEPVTTAHDVSDDGKSDGADRLTGRQLASLPGPRDAAWLRHAVRTPRQPGKAMIAIVIDDLGIDQKRTRRAIEMPGPMTMSFIPYGYKLARLTKLARAGGHEILLHLPMEPLRESVDPGPHAMLTTLGTDELRKRLAWNLARIEGYVGINNHMGSRFTAWQPGMRLVMREIRERGLLFLDSWTNKRSHGVKLAREIGVPSAVRDVFIDHDIDAVSIGKRLQQLESIARLRGFAIGIGHPYDLTTRLLPLWMAEAKERGIQFVPISTIVQRRMTAG